MNAPGKRRSALVTGAGSGIGRALALALAREGTSVLLVGRDAGKLATVTREVSASGGDATPCPIDLSEPHAPQTIATIVNAKFGQLDVLVHSAGVFDRGPVAEIDATVVRALIETNAVAPYAVTRALLAPLINAQGQVVMVNSSVVGARRGGVAAYAASKAALAAFADALREEVNPCGVRVLSVFVGRTATPMQARIFEMEDRAYDPSTLLQPDDVATIVTSALGLPRTAEVTDLHIRPMANPRVRVRPASPRTAFIGTTP